MLMFLSVHWVVMNGHSDNMRLNDDWIWNFHGHVNGEGHLNFLDDWNFDFLVNWELLNVMMVNCVHVIRNFNFNVMAAMEERIELN